MGMWSDLMAAFGADTIGFERGADRVQQKASMLEKSLQSIRNRFFSSFIARFGLNAIIRFGGEIIKQVELIDQLSLKFHLSTNEVQLLQQAAEDAGLTFEEMLKSAGHLEDLLARLKAGGKGVLFTKEDVEAVEAFKKGWAELIKWSMGQVVRTGRAFKLSEVGSDEYSENHVTPGKGLACHRKASRKNRAATVRPHFFH